jgi:hypothetical protein
MIQIIHAASYQLERNYLHHLTDKFPHLLLERVAQGGRQTSTAAMRPIPERIPQRPVEEPSKLEIQEMKMQVYDIKMEICQLKMKIIELLGVKLGGAGVVLAVVIGLFVKMYRSGVKGVAQGQV